jgi:hypothetical protein
VRNPEEPAETCNSSLGFFYLRFDQFRPRNFLTLNIPIEDVLHLVRQDHVLAIYACELYVVLFHLAARRTTSLTIQITTIRNA